MVFQNKIGKITTLNYETKPRIANEKIFLKPKRKRGSDEIGA